MGKKKVIIECENTGGKSDEQLTVSALKKKAFGYDFKEVVEEYVLAEDGEIKLQKKKVTTKNVPPDVTALKMLLEKTESGDLSEMSDQELSAEYQRLLETLKGKEK